MRVFASSPTNFDITNVSRIEKNAEMQDEKIQTDYIVNISSEASVSYETEKNIAKKYDVTSISEQDIITMSKELKDAGIISSKEWALMSFPHREAAARITGEGVDANEKFNFLQESTEKLAFMISVSAPNEQIGIQRNIVAVLSKLNHSR